MESFGSTSEDFRGVIDDLTVENQKLKRRLRAYERFHHCNLQDEELFAVRVHGLRPDKKRELEEKLREFASSLEDPSEDQLLFVNQQRESPVNLRQFEYRPKLSSAPTYNSLPVDSAYASMSASGNASISHSNNLDTQKQPESQASKNQNIRSYLQDIPQGLFPKHSPLMTENSRKMLVVRRLEQLFTGKGTSSGEQGQSHQQQEVSQSAAKADRTAIEARGQVPGAEGHREAKMLQPDSEVAAPLMGATTASFLRFYSDGDESSRVTDWSSSATLDQRPTRPLDVDPHRAQVAADNMDYIRHLGVASPRLDEHLASEDKGGWVYLNLLTGMAQLHTINVTPEFVRKALAEVSDRFELSDDGQKVRWRGGADGTRMRSDRWSSESPDDNDTVPDGFRPPYAARTGSSRKSAKTTVSVPEKRARISRGGSSARVHLSTTDQPTLPGLWHKYEPLFRGKAGSAGKTSNALSDDDSVSSSSSLEQKYVDGADRRQRPEGGPIIFYHGAKFCTDLSGDLGGKSHNGLVYSKLTRQVLGCVPKEHSSAATSARGPARESYMPEVDMVDDSEEMEEPILYGFNTPPRMNRADTYSGPSPIALEASGIGGVRPHDNFAIQVQVRRVARGEGFGIGRTSFSTMSQSNPPSLRRRFGQSLGSLARPHRIKSEILSTRKRNLPPSSLPPPSYIFIPSSSSNSDDSEIEPLPQESASHEPHPSPSLVSPIARVAPPLLHKSSTGSSIARAPPSLLRRDSTDSAREASPCVSDDSSIDMLAHAREIDPDSVAAREREFELGTVFDQPASEHVSTESLVATAGEVSWEDESTDGNSGSEDGSEDERPASRRKRGRDRDASPRGGVKRLRVRSPP
jgi:hypothetical protein